jgi:hypothetical protein
MQCPLPLASAAMFGAAAFVFANSRIGGGFVRTDPSAATPAGPAFFLSLDRQNGTQELLLFRCRNKSRWVSDESLARPWSGELAHRARLPVASATAIH